MKFNNINIDNFKFNGQDVLTVKFNGNIVYLKLTEGRITGVKIISRNSTEDTIIKVADHNGYAFFIVETEGDVGEISASLSKIKSDSYLALDKLEIIKYTNNLFAVKDTADYDNDVNEYDGLLVFSCSNSTSKSDGIHVRRINTSYTRSLNTDRGSHKVIEVSAEGVTNATQYFIGKWSLPENIGLIEGLTAYPYIYNQSDLRGSINMEMGVKMIIDSNHSRIKYNDDDMLTIHTTERLYNDAKVTYSIAPNTTNNYRVAIINVRYADATIQTDPTKELVWGEDANSAAALIIIQKPNI